MKKKETFGDRAADTITRFVGSWRCIGLHTLWFTLWFAFRLDENSLTLMVSLEAIILCTIIMMSQNRQSEKDRRTAIEDYATDMKAERYIEQMMAHLDKQDHLIIRILRQVEREVEEELATARTQKLTEPQPTEIPQ